MKEGDDIEITVAGKRDLKMERDGRRTKALDLLRRSKWKLPEGFKFDRGEANER